MGETDSKQGEGEWCLDVKWDKEVRKMMEWGMGAILQRVVTKKEREGSLQMGQTGKSALGREDNRDECVEEGTCSRVFQEE